MKSKIHSRNYPMFHGFMANPFYIFLLTYILTSQKFHGEIGAPTWRCGIRKQRCPQVRSCGCFLEKNGLGPSRISPWKNMGTICWYYDVCIRFNTLILTPYHVYFSVFYVWYLRACLLKWWRSMQATMISEAFSRSEPVLLRAPRCAPPRAEHGVHHVLEQAAQCQWK